MNTIVNNYQVNIVDEKNRINELLEECTYDILGVTHIDMNEFVEKLILETLDKTQEADDSGILACEYVMHHFGIE